MKVIIPVKNQEASYVKLVGGFHNAREIFLYDVESGVSEWASSESLCEHSGNLSIALRKLGVKDIICEEMSSMALGLFAESGFGIYKAEGDHLSSNIELYLNKELLKMSEAILAGTSCSGGSCSSCGSTCNA